METRWFRVMIRTFFLHQPAKDSSGDVSPPEQRKSVVFLLRLTVTGCFSAASEARELTSLHQKNVGERGDVTEGKQRGAWEVRRR